MKKFFKIASCFCLALCLFVGGSLLLSACNNKMDLAYGTVTRDPSQVGGATLSFVYDEKTHTATFGGAGQQVAYYLEDTALGREEGNRVGIQITAPEAVKDFSKAKITMGNNTYENGSFLDGDNYVWCFPKFTETKRIETIKITWTEDSKEQTYTVKLADGTTLAPRTTTNEPTSRNALNNNNNYYNNGTNDMYNGRYMNGYNRNFNRIRNNYSKPIQPRDVMPNNNDTFNNGNTQGYRQNGSDNTTMPNSTTSPNNRSINR